MGRRRRITATNWVRETTSRHKDGVTHRMLGIPPSQTIPFTLLERIRAARIGSIIKNPTKIGYPYIKVTRLLKQRAVWVLNLKRMRH